MTKVNTVNHLLQRLSEISDWKFAVGMHIRFAKPTLLYQTYPQAWIDYYNDEGLVLVDPAVRWAFANVGICDWSDLADADTDNVFGRAAEYGLKYGKVVSVEKDRSRTFGFFAHATREIAQSEIEEAQTILQELHNETEGIELATEKELARLRALNLALPRD